VWVLLTQTSWVSPINVTKGKSGSPVKIQVSAQSKGAEGCLGPGDRWDLPKGGKKKRTSGGERGGNKVLKGELLDKAREKGRTSTELEKHGAKGEQNGEKPKGHGPGPKAKKK